MRLRYILGGDRPSQTTRLTMSPDRLHGAGLEPQRHKGGISRTAPPELAPRFQSLPPILHIRRQDSRSGCSKGARGLSVLPRVAGIFTGTTISLSPSLRQCPSRYAIRAGRNLPDKEFRSVYPPRFPERPDFILTRLDSSEQRLHGSHQDPPPSNDRPLTS